MDYFGELGYYMGHDDEDNANDGPAAERKKKADLRSRGDEMRELWYKMYGSLDDFL